MGKESQIRVILFCSAPVWFGDSEQTDEMRVYYGQLSGLGMRIVFVDQDLDRLHADFVASLEPVPLLMTKEEMSPFIEKIRENGDIPINVGFGDPDELDISKIDLLVTQKMTDLSEHSIPHYLLNSEGAESWREFLEEMTRTINMIIRKKKYRPSSRLKDKDNADLQNY